jgi:hypothetical protein
VTPVAEATLPEAIVEGEYTAVMRAFLE